MISHRKCCPNKTNFAWSNMLEIYGHRLNVISSTESPHQKDRLEICFILASCVMKIVINLLVNIITYSQVAATGS